MSEDVLSQLVPVELLDVSPAVFATRWSVVRGVITIKWPYSSSAQKLTLLLADPDPRKRASGAQLKVTLLGPAAEFLDQIDSGEQLSIAPARGTLPLLQEEDSPRIKWHLTFHEGCILIVTLISGDLMLTSS